MHLHKHLRILATAATLAAISAPAAQASAIGEGGSGLPATTHHALAAHHSTNSTDWELVAITSAGAITLAGATLARRRRLAVRG
jgi:hypothetical protein